MKKLIVFDLDGTLAESKSPLDAEMATLLTAPEKEKIIRSLKEVSNDSGFEAAKVWGEVIEDRGSQITFSALGQQAPIVEKKKWDLHFSKRKTMKASLDKLIPKFSVRLGGTTSIDVTKPEIDKANANEKIGV